MININNKTKKQNSSKSFDAINDNKVEVVSALLPFPSLTLSVTVKLPFVL